MPELKIFISCLKKFCRKGQHIVDRSNFAKDSTHKDGLESMCKECKKKRNANYYQRNRHEKWGTITKSEEDAIFLRHMTRFINKASQPIVDLRPRVFDINIDI